MKQQWLAARLLVSVLGTGLGVFLPSVALAASFPSDGAASRGRTAVTMRLRSELVVAVHVSDRVRLADRLGLGGGRTSLASEPGAIALPATDEVPWAERRGPSSRRPRLDSEPEALAAREADRMLVAQRPVVGGLRTQPASDADETPAQDRGNAPAATSDKTPVPLKSEPRSTDVPGLRTKWNAAVEYPLRLKALDRQIALAKAQLESHQNRLDLYARYNVWAPPDTPSFTPSSVVPRNPSYVPGTMDEPVRAFSPASTFSHVLGEVRRKSEEAKLELDRLTKERALFVKGGPEAANRMPAAQAPLPDYAQRLKTLEADLEQAQFKHETYERRLSQFDKLSDYTYSVSFSDLREKLKLGRLEQQLRIDGLQEEKKLIEDHHGDWQRLQSARR
jgi:hypothetical protein